MTDARLSAGSESAEQFATTQPDGSVCLDAYAGKTREELKDRCRELVHALTEWQFAAGNAAISGGNKLDNVPEPYFSKIRRFIEAYSDDDMPPLPVSSSIPDVAQSVGKLPDNIDQRSLDLALEIRHKMDGCMTASEAAGRIRAFACDIMLAALAAQPPAAPVEPFDVMATIDPDHAESFDRPKCRLCGLEDGACICAHLRPRSSAATDEPSGWFHRDEFVLDTLNAVRRMMKNRDRSEAEELIYGAVQQCVETLEARVPTQSTASVRDGIAAVISDKASGNARGFILNPEAVADDILKNFPMRDEPQTLRETEAYRDTVQKVDASREKGCAAARANLQEAWAAMALIRETVETLGPIGAVPAAEHLEGPTFMHEAEALVNGIQALALSRPLPLRDGGDK